MRSHFQEVLKSNGAPKNMENIPDLWIYMSLWYGCLRVVSEGWQTLKLSDPTIDPLMDQDKISALNGFRNDVFHYQHDYFSNRTIKLLNDKGFVAWVHQVHDPIGLAILKLMKIDN